MVPLRRATHLAALLACAMACAAADPSAAAHQRACDAALGVLRRCGLAGGSSQAVQARCCSLLDAFAANGCLCPDCPPGASTGGAAAPGLMGELAQLMAACDPMALGSELAPSAVLAHLLGEGSDDDALARAALPRQPEELPEGYYDEDDLAADMAGVAAAAGNPRVRKDPVTHLPLGATAAQQQAGQQPPLDTPEDDWDNMLSDADAAFMLVDPAVAAAYAAATAPELEEEVEAGATEGLEADVQARLTGLLEQAAGAEAEAEAEEVASQAAVADAVAARATAADGVRLAPAHLVPDTPDHARAAGMAAALEARQVAHLATRQRQQRQRFSVGAGTADGSHTLSLDVTVDAGSDPDSARRMAESVTSLLRRWHAAAGSAASQSELASALEATARRVAAAAGVGALGRAGLHPKQLLLHQVEEQSQRHSFGGGGEEPRTCACMDVDLSSSGLGLDSEPLRRHYIRARLALCRFACQHQQTLVLLLAGELALCLVWLAIYLVRSRREGEGAQDQEPGDDCTSPQRQQFVIASAADPQWREDAAQLRQPLLSSSDSC